MYLACSVTSDLQFGLPLRLVLEASLQLVLLISHLADGHLKILDPDQHTHTIMLLLVTCT